MQSFISGAGSRAYQEFGGDFVLDALGIGGRRSDELSDALEDLRHRFRTTQADIRQDSTLSEQARLDELLELNKQYLKDRRELERQAEVARDRAWRDYVKQVVTDFGTLLYQQSQLRLAERATNFLFDTAAPAIFGGGGGGGGGTGASLSGLGNLFQSLGIGGGGGGGAAAGGGTAVGSTAAGVGVGTAATAGVTLASAAVAVNGLIDSNQGFIQLIWIP